MASRVIAGRFGSQVYTRWADGVFAGDGRCLEIKAPTDDFRPGQKRDLKKMARGSRLRWFPVRSARPDRGDRNRQAIPRLYVAADELVRDVRARDAEADEIVFAGPWDYAGVTEWLNRFEVKIWS